MTADANILINYARQTAQQFLKTYNEEIPCEQLVKRLCDLKQGYTQHGGESWWSSPISQFSYNQQSSYHAILRHSQKVGGVG